MTTPEEREAAAAARRAEREARLADRRARQAEARRRRDADRARAREEAQLRTELSDVYVHRAGPGRAAGAAPSETSLHWVVPARRAVVRDVISYGDLVELWIASLRRHLPVLATWYYDCSSASEKEQAVRDLLAGIAAVDAWRERSVAAVAAEGAHTVDVRGFRVRLWKGPLRVLKENDARAHGHAGGDEPADEEETAGAGGTATSPTASSPASSTDTGSAAGGAVDGAAPEPSAAGDPDGEAVTDNIYSDGEDLSHHEAEAIADPRRTARRHQPPFSLAVGRERTAGHEVTLVLNDLHEADPHGTTVFLPGDVVELPFWKLLQNSTHHSAYRDLEFDPEGSYLLGTSVRVRDQAGIPASAPLHDNLIGMRFQGLMNAARGAFFHDTVVFNGFANEAPKVDVGAATCYARGLMYAGSLVRGNTGRSSNAWVVENNHWGVLQGRTTQAHCLPNTTALANLASNRLTPGWTCTPSQGYMMMYMRNALAESWMRGSPGEEVTHADSPWWNDVDVTVADWFPPLDDSTGAWAVRVWEQRHAAGLVAPAAEPPEPHVPEAPPAAAPPPPADATEDERVRQYLSASDVQLRRQRDVPERRRALVEQMNYRIKKGRFLAQQRRAELLAEAAAEAGGAHTGDAAAAAGTTTGTDGTASSTDRILPDEPARSSDTPSRKLRDLRDITVRFVLSNAPDPELQTKGIHDLKLAFRDAANPPIGSAPELVNAFLEAPVAADNAFWQQINVVVMGNHSFGVVRLRRADALCDEPSPSPRKPPQLGFVTSYEPLSGVPHVLDGEDEQLYTFEAGGALARHTGGFSFFGCAPHHVKLIRRFRMRLHGRPRGSQTLHIDNLPMDMGSEGRPARLNAIIRLRDDRLAELHRAFVDQQRPFEPIGIGNKDRGFLVVEHPLHFYRERAVPFPSFDEGAADRHGAEPPGTERARHGDEVMPNKANSERWLNELRPGILTGLHYSGPVPYPDYVEAPAGMAEPARQRWNAMFNQSRRGRDDNPHG